MEERKPKENIKVTYTCLLCGRNKFTRKSPHYCVGGFRKRKIKWSINPTTNLKLSHIRHF